MSEQEQLITCRIHGKQPATFVCQHIVQSLTHGERVGFNCADAPGELRPDAWCDDCERRLMANGGEWDDASEEAAGINMICAGCYDIAKRLNLEGFVCDICGKVHDGLPHDIAYKRPADYFKIPEAERSTPIKLDDDKCVIDNEEYYIRGILALPVLNSEQEFCWGVWAKISGKDLRWYLKHWNLEQYEEGLSFSGFLSGGIKFYETSDLLEVLIHPQPGKLRPRFEVIDKGHPLGLAQCNGITLMDVHNFVAPFLW